MRIDSGPGSDASRPYLSPARLGLRLGVSVLHGRWCRSSPVGFRHKALRVSEARLHGRYKVRLSSFTQHFRQYQCVRWAVGLQSEWRRSSATLRHQDAINTGDYSMTFAYVNGKYRGVARTPYNDSGLANSQLDANNDGVACER
jgi:hypothetical protein